ncbi:hypothetical protein EDD16DRAFT_1489089, partial [Pisolithus croceorrhizus]
NRIFFTQSEMDKRSLLLDENGEVCIVDFKEVVLLPESIANHTCWYPSKGWLVAWTGYGLQTENRWRGPGKFYR